MDPTPIPKRFWWLKRLGILAAVLAVLIGGLRWYWGQLAQSRLDNALAKIRARGEPTRLEHLKQPDVPDKQNAAHYLRQALNHWPRVNGKLITETDWWTKSDDPVVGAGKNAKHPDPIQDQKAYLKRCEKSLKLLQKATKAPKTDWGVNLTSPALYIKVPHLSSMRQLGDVVYDAGLRANQTGNSEKALKLVTHQFMIAERVDREPAALIGALVAMGIRGQATELIQLMSHDINVGRRQTSTSTRSVSRELIKRLMDVQERRRELARAMRTDRLITYDTVNALIEGKVKPRNRPKFIPQWPMAKAPYWLMALIMKPQLQLDARIVLDACTATVKASKNATTMPEWERIYHKHLPQFQMARWRKPLHPFSSILLPAYSEAARSSFKSQADQQMAAVALAIRLYETDHGRRPKSLSQLVPEYLERVPGDPLASQRRPIQYRPNGVKPFSDRQWSRHGNAAGTQPARMNVSAVPLLYSVGENNQDDGGKFVVDSHGNVEYNDALDKVFLLEPAPEAPKAATTFKGPPWRRQGGRRGPPATQSARTQPATTRPAAEAEAGTQPATQPAGDGR